LHQQPSNVARQAKASFINGRLSSHSAKRSHHFDHDLSKTKMTLSACKANTISLTACSNTYLSTIIRPPATAEQFLSTKLPIKLRPTFAATASTHCRKSMKWLVQGAERLATCQSS